MFFKRFPHSFRLFFLFLPLSLAPTLFDAPPVSAELLSLRLNDAGQLEAVAEDQQSRDTARRKKGDALICFWKLPDIEKVQWPLKQRGIIYKRAYRRCFSPGRPLSVEGPRFVRGGSRVVFSDRQQGLWLMNRRGKFVSLPGYGSETGKGDVTQEAEPAEAARDAEPAIAEQRTWISGMTGYPGLFVLRARKDRSIISSLLDRWRSDLWWIPDLAIPDNSTMVMSRGNDRMENPLAVSGADFRRALFLREVHPEEPDAEGEPDAIAPELLEESPEPGSGELAEGEIPPPLDWPWYRMREALRAATAAVEEPEEPVSETPAIYFVQNRRRIGRLVPGESELTLFPELDPYVFRDGVPAFQVLDENSAVALSSRGVYRVDLPSGHHELVAALPVERIRHLYDDLAISPDRRFVALRAWTTARREEIYLVDLERTALRPLVWGEMDLRYDPAGDGRPRFNPTRFNFSPDGLSFVVLWQVQDGQEIRIYRLLNGRHASVPLKPEEPEENVEGDETPSGPATVTP